MVLCGCLLGRGGARGAVTRRGDRSGSRPPPVYARGRHGSSLAGFGCWRGERDGGPSPNHPRGQRVPPPAPPSAGYPPAPLGFDGPARVRAGDRVPQVSARVGVRLRLGGAEEHVRPEEPGAPDRRQPPLSRTFILAGCALTGRPAAG